MKLVTFTHQGQTEAGIVTGDEVVALRDRAGAPLSVRAILEAGADGAAHARKAAASKGERFRLSDVRLKAPVPDPRKYLGLGGNYHAHIAEVKRVIPSFELPKTQYWFNKQVTCIIGPYDAMEKPSISDQFDYEGELGVVIGARGRRVKAADAHRMIAGYVVCNDASVRDWQQRTPGGMMGKSFDTHGPIGPWLTMDISIEQAEDLEVRTWVNGALRQQGRTSDFIYRIGQMIEELTTVFTLEPGDILSTGTPPGVGAAMTPPGFLKVGDTVRIEIEGLGVIENPVVAEAL